MDVICICLNLFVWGMIIFSFKSLKATKGEKIIFCVIIFAVVLTGLACYCLSVSLRKMIYFWDWSNYYNIQLQTNELVSCSFVECVKKILQSFFYDDYNCFICLFLVTPFRVLKVHTVDDYIILYYCLEIIPVLISMALVLLKSMEIFRVINKKWIFVIGYIGCTSIPLLHQAALDGQPDIWGLFFCFLLIFYTCDYDFDKIQVVRWGLLIAMTEMLILTRRWYLFWIIGFWVTSGIRVLCKKQSEWRRKIKNLILFAGIGMAFVGGSLFPLWKRIMSDNYAADYSFYNIGGLGYEWYQQVRYLGFLLFGLMIFLFVKSVFNKQVRSYAIMTGFSWLIAIVLFTRIQNAGGHQSLIFLCSYIYIIFLGMCSWTWNPYFLMAVFGGISLFNLVIAVNGGESRGIASNIDLKPVVREDYEDVGRVYQFLTDSIMAGENGIYIIPHGYQYNPDTFRNYIAPGTLSDYIPYGAAVTGVHGFPEEFCAAEYVMTCDPLCDLDSSEKSIVKLLNNALEYLIKKNRFRLVREFEFKNGTVFYCYERIQSVDDFEIDYLETVFEHLCDQYPERWKNTLEKMRQEL